ncbi:LVIS_2131 family protein [Lacticaseibacillus baoqingensis]|uniref:LVIS_2131 family protein n=1 Tax=Lacticaseibacillus baoqingensis TaxID=2486013 RepID=A0ABW4E775_9LACO|nr:LVIS_2131 family protein [Lacticaseibacillus baoqingensis]
MNSWNLLGLVAWLLVLAYLGFVVWNIRQRHLKMLVVLRQQHSVKTVLIDCLEVLLLAVVFYGMAWVTWLRQPDYSDRSALKVTYNYANLVLQTDSDRSYYVSVTSGNGKHPVHYYTYWTHGAKYQISSRNADVSDATDALTVRASAYPWSTKQLAKLEKTQEKAYVATYIGTYKPTFLNGLGLRVGRTAQRFSLIRIPNDTFQKVVSAHD